MRGRDGDTLQISIGQVFSDSSHDLGVDPGLVKDGVEAHLQALLAEHPGSIAAGLSLVRREHPTRSARSTCSAATPTTPTSRSRSNGAARSTASSSSPATASC